jgi:hypothetical protein
VNAASDETSVAFFIVSGKHIQNREIFDPSLTTQTLQNVQNRQLISFLHFSYLKAEVEAIEQKRNLWVYFFFLKKLLL